MVRELASAGDGIGIVRPMSRHNSRITFMTRSARIYRAYILFIGNNHFPQNASDAPQTSVRSSFVIRQHFRQTCGPSFQFDANALARVPPSPTRFFKSNNILSHFPLQSTSQQHSISPQPLLHTSPHSHKAHCRIKSMQISASNWRRRLTVCSVGGTIGAGQPAEEGIRYNARQ